MSKQEEIKQEADITAKRLAQWAESIGLPVDELEGWMQKYVDLVKRTHPSYTQIQVQRTARYKVYADVKSAKRSPSKPFDMIHLGYGSKRDIVSSPLNICSPINNLGSKIGRIGTRMVSMCNRFGRITIYSRSLCHNSDHEHPSAILRACKRVSRMWKGFGSQDTISRLEGMLQMANISKRRCLANLDVSISTFDCTKRTRSINDRILQKVCRLVEEVWKIYKSFSSITNRIASHSRTITTITKERTMSYV